MRHDATTNIDSKARKLLGSPRLSPSVTPKSGNKNKPTEIHHFYHVPLINTSRHPMVSYHPLEVFVTFASFMHVCMHCMHAYTNLISGLS